MQKRLLLVALLAMSVALAGCAQNDGPGSANGNTTGPGGNGGATPPKAVSNEEAQTLFASAAGAVPERYGMDMTAKNATTTIMTARAVYDDASQTMYMRMEMDDSVLQDMGDGMTMSGDTEALKDIAILVSPQGNAFLVNGTVMVTEPEEGQFDQAAQEEDGFAALSDPEEFIQEMKENNFTVTSVTPTTLRGKGALKLDATVVEEGVKHNMSVWLFQDPTRIARIETTMPAEPEDDDSPFQDATMTLDMLYDSEVTLQIPEDLKRALGLRYASDRSAFSFGGDEEGPETWTFQVDGGLALSEIQAEVGDFETDEVSWSMLLSESPKTQDGITLTFTDADGDGKVSANDTLAIERSDEAFGSSVALRDNVTGLRVVPGFGALLAALALAGAVLVLRRR